jgi:tyrosyl-tRNA synthetase
MSHLLDELAWRGLVYQVTDADALARRLSSSRVTGYIGFDPTADSLHVGHLQQICLLRRLQEAGHRPIALLGGGTGMIGDPSGKSDERALLDQDTLDSNRSAIARQLASLIDFGPPDAGSQTGAILVDNAEWLAPVKLLDFLREVGKAFSVNEMIRKESVRSRLERREQSLSFTEFSYMLLQAWDFLQLYDRYGCEMQMGGSDQWGNITEGVDLIRRLRQATAFGLTSPLVTKADGRPFGKTEQGAVWLDSERTSAYEFFQFWLNTADEDAGSYLRRFSFLSREHIESLEAATKEHPERRDAQRALARELTSMVHGADAAKRAERAAGALFSAQVADLDAETLEMALAGAPATFVTNEELAGGIDLAEALQRCGLAPSLSDARRRIVQGGIYINGVRAGEERRLQTADALHGRWVVLRSGKRDQHLLVVQR